MRALACLLLIAGLLPAAVQAQEPGYPTYCCTDAGRFGPFSNGTVNVGERCSAADTTGVRHVGTACHGPANPLTLGPMDTTGYADRCCTDIGVLGPVAGATWLEGDSCAATTADGAHHAGVACYGVSGLLERARRTGRVLAAARSTGCGASQPATLRTALAVASPASPVRKPPAGSR
jgi:hypothetical protein